MLVTATLIFMVIKPAAAISVNILTWKDSYPYVVKKQNESNS